MLDGDGDRAVLIDDRGVFYDGDSLLAIFATHLSANQALAQNTIVAPPMSNSGLAESLIRNGIKVEKVRNGEKYIIDKLLADLLTLSRRWFSPPWRRLSCLTR